ncbi:toxin VasX, partial [Achromobacter mucicolens]|uniref:toxin VasX n=1 Tax=Achromobacter mucicolens TaxID=1389922 RepID=UPI001C2E75FB
MNQVSLEELLSQAVDVARRTRRDEAPSPCVDCKSEVGILPLRYAVVTSEDPETLGALAPELPRNLGLGLPALQAKGVRYAVRAMRQGCLYAFIKRFGKWNCESAWRATGTGVFSPFRPYSPDLQYAPEPRRLLGYGGWTILFKAPEDIQEARLLFTPDVLTERMLDKLRDTDSLRNKLQAFDIKEIASSCSFAPDVLDMS